jgi:nitroimidazol reductase NimA-like FMN-containing flavoprotein (pyridoxamine 5'-phosphate oxidase superfamily)
MKNLPLAKTSQWSEQQINDFLTDQKIPIRLCCNRDDGFPVVCSMWYAFDGVHLWCAVHESALISKLLAADNKCAFEIAPNDMPYRGVRGHGIAELVRADAAEVLAGLLQRYEINDKSHLAKWLMSRKEEEYAIKITPEFVTSWDYALRMAN